MLRSLATSRRLGGLGVLAVLAVGALAGAAPRIGKVVRIERTRKPAAPRICSISPKDLTGSCVGKKPEPGEPVLVVDTHRVLATLRVASVSAIANCTENTVWTIKAELESGELTPPLDSQTVGLLDLDADERHVRLVKPDHTPGDRQVGDDNVVGVDVDGDGAPDFGFLLFGCDADNQLTTGSSDGYCIETWYAVGKSWELTRVDRVLASCT